MPTPLRVAYFLLALSLGCGQLSSKSLVHESFHADIRVLPSGDIVVTETLRCRFEGSWNGIYRFIPVDYRSARGFNYGIGLEVDSVTDGKENPLRFESGRENHYRKLQIWVPNAQDAVRTIVIRYRVSRALLFFEEHDELYWNVTGDEGAIPILSASAVVELPAGASEVRTQAFTGPYGSTAQNATESIRENRVEFRTTSPLGIREGLTIVVAWAPGLVHRPSLVERTLFFLARNWLFALPFLAFGLMYQLWSRLGRDPEIDTIVARYQPPEGLTPGELGTLIDHSPDMRDIIATLVELAVQGFIHIKEFDKEKWLGLSSDTEYRFTLLRNRVEWGGLRSHQSALLRGIFKDGKEWVDLSDLQNKFYKELPGIKDGIFEELIRKGYYGRRPDKLRQIYLVGAVILFGLSIAAAAGGVLGMSPLSILLPGVLTAGVVAAFGWLMPSRTRAGSKALEEALGFQEFLERVDSDRYRRMITGPEMFERFLPYAIALKVDEQWAKAFADLVKEPPQWYSGSHAGHFQTRGFVSNLGRMTSQASTTLSSAPRSSGSSGFGGGGFSGGGGGGGGTSGF